MQGRTLMSKEILLLVDVLAKEKNLDKDVVTNNQLPLAS